jgi:DNA-binding MarR family transcriptional regulator
MKTGFDVAVSDLIQAVGLLVRRVRSAAASHELSLTEGAVLKRLAKEGPATTADLARAESMKPQSMGATVAALEEEELVKRRPDPTDGRRMYIHLTDKGVALREDARAARRMWLEQAIAQLDKEDQVALFKASEIIKRLAEQ